METPKPALHVSCPRTLRAVWVGLLSSRCVSGVSSETPSGSRTSMHGFPGSLLAPKPSLLLVVVLAGSRLQAGLSHPTTGCFHYPVLR